MHVSQMIVPIFCQANRFAIQSGQGPGVKIDREELMIMKESDIMGNIEGGASVAKTS